MKLKGTAAGDLNGFLDAGSHIQGELHFDDTFRIDGRLTGKVVSEGDLVVGVGGEVEGEVCVGRVFVSGTVRGRVHASRRLEISANGRVYADLETPSLVVEDGAFVEGSCSMASAPKAEAPAKPLAAVPALPAVKER
jgi:cytoskeletal protein CcmA (bactofilin family)